MRLFERLARVSVSLALVLLVAGWMPICSGLSPMELQGQKQAVTQGVQHMVDAFLSGAQDQTPGPLTADDFRYILHAGGVTLDGDYETNSLEALNYSYLQGYRVMELDFVWTLDGEPVCLHDWDSLYPSKMTGGDRPTLALFESLRKGSYRFTSLTLEDLANWMTDHPEVYIVTDVKEDLPRALALIAQRYPDLRERFVVQIYHPDQYADACDLGFTKIIYTLYTLSFEEKMNTAAIGGFVAQSPNILGITVAAELLTPEYAAALKASGRWLFTHTVDDKAEQEALFAMGVDGIYANVGRGR